mmetsp:Transcript_16175/g.36386  ORF Transcript_16175/g.36386 Transcript_16175/m.36386 type:complete len:438 (-) Transcript_16175:138-1451(-)
MLQRAHLVLLDARVLLQSAKRRPRGRLAEAGEDGGDPHPGAGAREGSGQDAAVAPEHQGADVAVAPAPVDRAGGGRCGGLYERVQVRGDVLAATLVLLGEDVHLHVQAGQKEGVAEVVVPVRGVGRRRVRQPAAGHDGEGVVNRVAAGDDPGGDVRKPAPQGGQAPPRGSLPADEVELCRMRLNLVRQVRGDVLLRQVRVHQPELLDHVSGDSVPPRLRVQLEEHPGELPLRRRPRVGQHQPLQRPEQLLAQRLGELGTRVFRGERRAVLLFRREGVGQVHDQDAGEAGPSAVVGLAAGAEELGLGRAGQRIKGVPPGRGVAAVAGRGADDATAAAVAEPEEGAVDRTLRLERAVVADEDVDGRHLRPRRVFLVFLVFLRGDAGHGARQFDRSERSGRKMREGGSGGRENETSSRPSRVFATESLASHIDDFFFPSR